MQLQAQVKVVDIRTTINSNAALEIESNTKDFILPRIALANAMDYAPMTAPIEGMSVYNTDLVNSALLNSNFRIGNSVFGCNAFKFSSSGNYNNMLGYKVAKNATTGNNNVFIGTNVASNMVSGDNILV